MQFIAKKRRQPPTIIIISLIDILIVLLIFLMVTTTFKQQPALKLTLPQSNQARPGASAAPLVVTIASQEPYFHLGSRAINLDRLQQEFKASAARNPNFSLSIRVDANAPFGQVVKVMDAASAAKIRPAIEFFVKKSGQP